MATAPNPFLDPVLLHGALYGNADRLASRTTALHRAKVAGRPVAEVIVELARAALPSPQHATVADIGCGRGTTTRQIAADLRPAVLIGVDASAALLAAARHRAGTEQIRWVRSDFHRLPLADRRCDLVVAAFCLYHSPRPTDVLAEIGRCLAPGGVTVMVTKSADSYRSLDRLVADAGLDPHALERPSLYAAAHTDNLADLLADGLRLGQVIHETHRFRFTDLTHVAQYLATSPKYRLPDHLCGNPARLATALRRRLRDRPVTATSTITYVLAHRQRTRTGASP